MRASGAPRTRGGGFDHRLAASDLGDHGAPRTRGGGFRTLHGFTHAIGGGFRFGSGLARANRGFARTLGDDFGREFRIQHFFTDLLTYSVGFMLGGGGFYASGAGFRLRGGYFRARGVLRRIGGGPLGFPARRVEAGADQPVR